MKLWDKIKKAINPYEEEHYGDVFENDEIYGVFDGGAKNTDNTDMEDFITPGGYSPYGNPNHGGISQVQQFSAPEPPDNGGITVSGGGNMRVSLELKVVRPEDYNNPNEIADHLLGGKTVILNLEETSNETARRLMAFLRGAAYAVNGKAERVSSRTFVITPSSIIVSSDRLKEGMRKNTGNDGSVNPERSSKSTI